MKTLIVIALLSLTSYAQAETLCQSVGTNHLPLTLQQKGDNFRMVTKRTDGTDVVHGLISEDGTDGNAYSGFMEHAYQGDITKMGVFRLQTNVGGAGRLFYTTDGAQEVSVDLECQ